MYHKETIGSGSSETNKGHIHPADPFIVGEKRVLQRAIEIITANPEVWRVIVNALSLQLHQTQNHLEIGSTSDT